MEGQMTESLILLEFMALNETDEEIYQKSEEQLSKRFLDDPMEYLRVRDIVSWEIEDIDEKLHELNRKFRKYKEMKYELDCFNKENILKNLRGK